MATAFYEPLGKDRYGSGEHTVGPWGPDRARRPQRGPRRGRGRGRRAPGAAGPGLADPGERAGAAPAPAGASIDAVPAFPEENQPFFDWTGGFLAAMQWRFGPGTWPGSGRGTVWGRMPFPLVDGEEPSGLQRLLVIADCGNGVSFRLPLEDWLVIHTELTVHLAAPPRGEWNCLDATTRLDPSGFGLASSRLFDRHGLVGVGAQTLYVAPRERVR